MAEVCRSIPVEIYSPKRLTATSAFSMSIGGCVKSPRENTQQFQHDVKFSLGKVFEIFYGLFRRQAVPK